MDYRPSIQLPTIFLAAVLSVAGCGDDDPVEGTTDTGGEADTEADGTVDAGEDPVEPDGSEDASEDSGEADADEDAVADSTDDPAEGDVVSDATEDSSEGDATGDADAAAADVTADATGDATGEPDAEVCSSEGCPAVAPDPGEQALAFAAINWADDMIFIINLTETPIDIDGFELCYNRFAYRTIDGETMVPSFGQVAIDLTELSSPINATADGEFVLFDHGDGAADRSNPDHVEAFVTWGGSHSSRVSTAVSAGVWESAADRVEVCSTHDAIVLTGEPQSAAGYTSASAAVCF
jgi:hypothetical protein